MNKNKTLLISYIYTDVVNLRTGPSIYLHAAPLVMGNIISFFSKKKVNIYTLSSFSAKGKKLVELKQPKPSCFHMRPHSSLFSSTMNHHIQLSPLKLYTTQTVNLINTSIFVLLQAPNITIETLQISFIFHHCYYKTATHSLILKAFLHRSTSNITRIRPPKLHLHHRKTTTNRETLLTIRKPSFMLTFHTIHNNTSLQP